MKRKSFFENVVARFTSDRSKRQNRIKTGGGGGRQTSRKLRLEALESRELLAADLLTCAAVGTCAASSSDFVDDSRLSDVAIPCELADVPAEASFSVDGLTLAATSDSEAASTIVTTLDDVVDSTDGKISLREAISCAGTGELGSTITFDASLDGGTITLATGDGYGRIVIAKSLEIDATALTDGITISGGHTDTTEGVQIFDITAGTEDDYYTVAFKNLSLKDGYASETSGDEEYEESGGAVFIGTDNVVEFVHCELSNNTAVCEGGAIMADMDSKVTLTDTIISGNFGNDGGGVSLCLCSLTVTNTVISNNTAEDGNGGGVYCSGSLFTATNTTISGNTADDEGGGVYCSGSSFTTTNTTISGNTADDEGGGVYCSGSLFTATNTTISENTAEYGGGGVCLEPGSAFSSINTVVSQNTAYEGGGVFILGDYPDIDEERPTDEDQPTRDRKSTYTAINTAIWGNVATGDGGGVYVFQYGFFTSINCTISGNTSGVSSELGESFTAYNTVLSQNYDSDFCGTLSDESANNLIGGDPSFVCAPVFDESGALTNAAALDLHLQSASAAVNRGNNEYAVDADGQALATDLDGLTRIVNGTVDIGAYERQTPSVSVSFSGPVKVRYRLWTVVVSDDATLSYSYQWYRGETAVDGANKAFYDITLADVGYALTVKVRVGDVDGEEISATTEIVPHIALDAPTVFQATARSETTSVFSWNAVTNATGYLFEYSTDGEVWKEGEVDGLTGSITGLTDGATYYCRVKALGETPYCDSEYATTISGTELASTVVTTLDDVVNAYDGKISLREAITYAGIGELGSTITFDASLDGGTSTLVKGEGYGCIVIAKSLTIDASALTNGIAISGGNTDTTKGTQIFRVDYSAGYKSSTVEFMNLTLKNGCVDTKYGVKHKDGDYRYGYYGGAVLIGAGADVAFRDCKLIDNQAGNFGGAIAACDHSKVRLYNTTITGNSAAAHGGAIAAYNYSKVTLYNTTITENSGNSGGAIYLCSSTVTAYNSTISGNSSSSGGGVYVDSKGTFKAKNTIISGNAATYSGGGVAVRSGGSFVSANVVVSGNTAEYGGGVYIDSDDGNTGTYLSTNTTISGNSADNGGGVYLVEGAGFTAQNTLLSKNYSVDLVGTVADKSSNNVIGDDPSFVCAPVFDEEGALTNADTLDLRLQSNSVAVNQGNWIYINNERYNGFGQLAYGTDLDGLPRIVFGTVDIGAYECQCVPLTGVSISGTVKVGEKLEANAVPAYSKRSYQWYRGETAIEGAQSETYEIVLADVGYALTVKVSGSVNLSGEVSATTEIVPPVALGKPDSFAVIARNETTLSVGWSAVKNSSGYAFEYSTDGEVWETGEVDGLVGSVSGLNADTTYLFRVKALGEFPYCDSEYVTTSSDSELASTVVTTLDDVVDPTDGKISLREAIFYSGIGGLNSTVSFDASLDGGTITLALTEGDGRIVIDKSLEIDASALTNGISISGNNKTQIFKVANGTESDYYTVAFKNLTLKNGNADIWYNDEVIFSGSGGAVHIGYYDVVEFIHCELVDNQASFGGGAIIAEEKSSVTLTDTTVARNTAQLVGGGIFAYKATVTAINTTISENYGSSGGGGYYGDGHGSSLTTTNCVISNNESQYGGGIWSPRSVTVINTTISENTADNGGGVFSVGDTFTAIGSTISGNEAQYGGGVSSLANFTAISSTISGNSSTIGGGVYCWGAGVFSSTNTIVSQNAAEYGGGVFICASSNYAGMAAYVATNTAIWGNVATDGGGVYVSTGTTFTSTNSTISGNSATNGGGVFVEEYSEEEWEEKGKEYGGSYEGTGTFTAYNTVLTQNYNADLAGTLSDQSSNNLIGDDPAFVCAPVFDESGKLTNADALDLHLQTDSDAVDRGNDKYAVDADGQTLTTDLDGLPRIVYKVDIGAYEVQPDLAFHVPTGWQDSVIVSTSSSAKSSKTTYLTTQNVNLRFACQSTTPISGTFVQQVYVDGVLKKSFMVKGNGVVDQSDVKYAIGKLSEGKHTITVKLDATNAILESDEDNNERSITITVLPDDKYERNDTLKTATDLGKITSTQTYSGLVAGINSNQDWFKFTLSTTGASDSYVEAAYTHVSGRDDVNLYLYDASGKQLVKSKGLTGTERISLEGRAAGTYYVMAYNYLSVSNNVDYTLKFVPFKDDAYEPNNSRARATDLGTITSAKKLTDLVAGAKSNQDWFKFTLPTSGTSNFAVKATYAHVSGRDDVNLYLYDASGKQLVKSKGATGTETISLIGREAGTYYVMAYNYLSVSNAVDYTLEFVETDDAYEPNNTRAKATNLGTLTSTKKLTDLVAGAKSNQDWFKFTLSTSGTSNFEVKATYAHVSGRDDVNLYLYDASGKQLVKSKGTTGTETISLIGCEAGTYYVMAYNYLSVSNAVNYTLEFVQTSTPSQDDHYEPNNSRAKATDVGTLTSEKTLTNLVAGAKSNQDWFKFTLPTAGTSDSYVELTYAHVTGRDDVNLYLYDASGKQLVKSKRLTGTEKISLDGRAAGTYYVMAYNYLSVSNAVGYTLKFVPSAKSQAAPVVMSANSTKDDSALFRSAFEDDGFTFFEEDEDEFWFA